MLSRTEWLDLQAFYGAPPWLLDELRSAPDDGTIGPIEFFVDLHEDGDGEDMNLSEPTDPNDPYGEDGPHLADDDNGYPASGSHHISQARLTNRIDLFNPNHDRAGRFATGGGTGLGGVPFLRDGAAQYMSERGLGTHVTIDPSKVRADPKLGKAAAAAYAAAPNQMPLSPITRKDPLGTISGVQGETVHAYAKMHDEVQDQYQFLTGRLGVKVSFVDNDPYASAADMAKDVRDNKHLAVFKTSSTPPGHPFFTDEVNDQFRAVHDAFGHAAIGSRFDRHGERAAYLEHRQMFSPDAARAMATETHGQNSAFIWSGPPGHRQFPEQKVILLPPEVL